MRKSIKWIALLAAASAGLLPSISPGAEPSFQFGATVDPAALQCLQAAKSAEVCQPVGAPFDLGWKGGSLVDGAIDSPGIALDSVSLQVRLEYAREMTDSVMVPLSFSGELKFDGAAGSTYSVSQNNIDIFFPRALYVKEERVVKFLLPAKFTNPKEKTRYGILAFNCDSSLSICAVPKLVFSRQVAKAGLAPVGFESNEISEDIRPLFGEDAFTSCCADAWSGKCRCIRDDGTCTSGFCANFILGGCLDCQDIALCNC